jgi:glycosyltransferase involved in cell wall biosynthesis
VGVFFCAFVIAHLGAEETERKTVCLNMIVKNESQVIEKCLASVKPLIDYYVIVDTGSTDNTQEVIKNCLKGIPGELHERPWVNFAHNRNEALAFAKDKGDYLLLIDADEFVEISEGFSLGKLDKDLYFILVRQLDAGDVKRNGLINNHLNWKWAGVIHEYLHCPDVKTSETLKGIRNICNSHPDKASGRSKESSSAKYLRDAEVLQKALEDEPTNSRYAYYLGISYAAAERHDLAKKAFEKRIAMASNDVHETFMALYNLGLEQFRLKEYDPALESLFAAYAFRPIRAEPLLVIAKIYREKGKLLLSYLIAQHALSHRYPEDELCVEYAAYDYRFLIEFANSALLLGYFNTGLDACAKLLAKPNLPSEYKPMIESNYRYAQKNLRDK